MPSARYHSSRSSDWQHPRPHTDASQRFQTYGPIVPMDEDMDFTLSGFVKGVGALMLGMGLLAGLWVMVP